MDKKTKTKDVDIHCACAIGDLSELAELIPVKKNQTKVPNKNLKKDNTKKKST